MDIETARAHLFKHLSRDIRDMRVIEAMQSVPRELFVPETLREVAYDDRPLSIGYGQTISQPSMVAMMIEALDLKETDKVLELGAGSGYVAAILSHMVERVITVEIVPELADFAASALAELGYANIDVHLVPKSTLGYMPEAPYDAIIVSAGAPTAPPLLLAQLKWHGRLVIPIGSRWQQELTKITRLPEGDVVESLGACYFVPLLGEGAWKG